MLSKVTVIEAALDLVDADGLGALNLRKLATRLGVSAMTPYGLFADKAELLVAMLGHALAPLDGDLDPAAPWEQQLNDAMRGLRRALQLHPGVVELIIVESDAARLEDFRQRLISCLEGAGLSRSRSADVLRSLTSYILGYTVLSRLRPEHGGPARSRDSFSSGLDMIMDSLRREIAGSESAPRWTAALGPCSHERH